MYWIALEAPTDLLVLWMTTTQKGGWMQMDIRIHPTANVSFLALIGCKVLIMVGVALIGSNVAFASDTVLKRTVLSVVAQDS